MKKLITIALLISSLSTMAQSNKRYQNGLTFLTNPPISKMDTDTGIWEIPHCYKLSDTIDHKRSVGYHYYKDNVYNNLMPINANINNTTFPIFNIFNGNKPILNIEFKKDGKSNGLQPDWDVMEIHLSKKQFHWLNDSTAIFIKPNK